MASTPAGKPSQADIAALDSLRSKLIPVVGNIATLQHAFASKPNVPLDWPAVQRNIANLLRLLSSMQSLLYKDPETIKTFHSLHAYPTVPFSIENPNMAGLVEVIMRKKPEPGEEKWILDCLAKAAEFAHVPSDWEIEPRRPTKADEQSDDEDDEEAKNSIKARFKRQQGTLDEDEIAHIWNTAASVMTEEIGKAGAKFMGGNESEDDDDDDDDDDDEEDEDEDEDTTMNEADVDKNGGAAAKQEKREPPMPLENIHRFMATGLAG